MDGKARTEGTGERNLMELIDRKKVLTMVRRSLNMVDSRLVDHGLKAALVLQDMLSAEGCRDAKLRKDLGILALFHDIGAYRTEEIDQLVQFETGNVWGHAIYSYLFLRDYFPEGDRAKVALYHHADYNGSWQEDAEILHYAQMLHIADRVCIWHDEVKRSKEALTKHLADRNGTVFAPEAVELFWKADQQYGAWDKLHTPPSLEMLTDCADLSRQEAEAYLHILVNAIDFRSRTTVTHTKSLMEISLEMARLAGLPEESQKQIYYGALMHDLGKIGTPLSILEKPGRLTPEEMEVMKQHVTLSAQIIQGCVEETTAQIALRHHEKLDGSGYPCGLSGEELTLPQRLVAVADIVSALCMSRSYKEAFPKERCLSVLREMCDRGQLDESMVSLVEREYDYLIDTATARCVPLQEGYARMQEQFEQMMRCYTA